MLNKNNKKLLWYIIHCNSGQENTVAELIKVRANNAGLSDYIEEIFIPVQEKVTIKRGAQKSIKEKVFRGYIFIKMVLNDKTWPLVKDTQGVINFAGSDKKPTPISPQEIEAIKKYCEQNKSSYNIKLNVGDKVKINVGDFKDFNGIVKDIDENSGKVVVQVQFLNREIPVELDITHLTLV